jgi:phosphatidylserine/phosphatidylglycerophosphate/cardiolipin synthase-like enzyme
MSWTGAELGCTKSHPQVEQQCLRNSIAIGTSSVHNAISHLKIVIVDGVYTVKGSTNWSLSGEQQQDNELSLSRNAVIAAETRAILDLNHDFMLKQMVGSKLDVAKFLAPKAPATAPPLPPQPASAGRRDGRGQGGSSGRAGQESAHAQSHFWRRWWGPPRPAG